HLESGPLAEQGLDDVRYGQRGLHPVAERVPGREDDVVGVPRVRQGAAAAEAVDIGARDDAGAPRDSSVADERENLLRALPKSLADLSTVLPEHAVHEVERHGATSEVRAPGDLGDR